MSKILAISFSVALLTGVSALAGDHQHDDCGLPEIKVELPDIGVELPEMPKLPDAPDLPDFPDHPKHP